MFKELITERRELERIVIVLKDYKLKIDNIKSEIPVLERGIKEQKKTIITLGKEIDIKRKEKTLVEDEIKNSSEILVNNNKELDDEILIKKNELVEIEDKIIIIQDKIMSSEKNEKTTLKSLQDEIEILEKRKEDIVDNNSVIKKEADDYVIKKTKEAEDIYNSKIDEIEDREGLVSDRETWLDKKTELLRDIKKELEEWHGKRIKNINI